MKTLLATLLLILSFSAPAKVLVYRMTIAQKNLGNHVSSKATYPGYFLIDTDSGQMVGIVCTTLGKTYEIVPLSDWFLSYVYPSIDASLLVIRQATSSGDSSNPDTDSTWIRGLCSNGVNIGDGSMFGWSIPKTMTGAGKTFISSGWEDGETKEQTFTMVFNSVLTITSNRAGDDLAAATVRVSTRLEGLGYTEW